MLMAQTGGDADDHRRVWNRGDDRMKLIVLGPSLDDVRERAAERQAAADAERARCRMTQTYQALTLALP